MELIIGNSLEIYCANVLEKIYASPLFNKYEDVLTDDELIDNDLKFYNENIDEAISLWKRKCKEYEVSDDPYFFIYCMSLYHGILDETYGYSFLYGESESLASNEDLNKVLSYINSQRIDEISNEDRCVISY